MSAHAGEERLGPYRLRQRLGEGGMGVVYLASGPDDQPVAVKVLRQGVPAEATAKRRLAREVDTMRRVHSPHVAEVVDAAVEHDPPYIVTRYVAGRTLEDVVAAEGPVTGAALGSLASGLADALVAIHSAGVVHRDLKPANVLLVDGEPVVIDFGIAQAADSTRLTLTGMFMGTPGYLAPEIIEGGPSGPSADVHSLGATLAYAATGRPPFGTGQFEAIFYRIVHGQPDLDRIPVQLRQLVLSTLAKDPELRPSAAEVAASVAALDPAALLPAPAIEQAGPAALVAVAEHSVQDATVQDQAVQSLSGAQTLTASPAVPAPVKPATMPFVAPGPDDFADLLPPVRYEKARGKAAAAGSDQALAGNGAAHPLSGPAWPAGSLASPAGPFDAAAAQGSPTMGWRRPAAAKGETGRKGTPLLLVLATLAVLVAISVLLPVAGAAVALTVLICLRAADLTSRWLGKRRSRQGTRGSDPAAAVAFYPWAICRSALRFVVLSPVALLCAAAVAVLSVLAAGPGSLPKSVSYAVGALVACYCIGPGSAGCRRPLTKLYGNVTRSLPAALLGSIGLVAVAAATVVAAATLAPGFWPAAHVGNQLQTASFTHPTLNHLPASLGDLGSRFMHWLGHHL